MHKIQTGYFQLILIVAFIFFIGERSFAQAEIPPKPTLQTSVYDGAKMLSGYENSNCRSHCKYDSR